MIKKTLLMSEILIIMTTLITSWKLYCYPLVLSAFDEMKAAEDMKFRVIEERFNSMQHLNNCTWKYKGSKSG